MYNQGESTRRSHAAAASSYDRATIAERLRLGALISALALTSLLVLGACLSRGSGAGIEVVARNGALFVAVDAYRDTVMQAISHVLAQERIALRRYEPEAGHAESGFLDIARYASFDPEIWDDTERLIKLRFIITPQDSISILECQPLYNPYEVVTDEVDEARLRPVPNGHPGFEVAVALTRRIAAFAEGKAVVSP